MKTRIVETKKKPRTLSPCQRQLLDLVCRGGEAYVEFQGRAYVVAVVILENIVYESTVQTFRSLVNLGLLRQMESRTMPSYWWAEMRRHYFAATEAGRKAHREEK